jgi:hypothetical protein
VGEMGPHIVTPSLILKGCFEMAVFYVSIAIGKLNKNIMYFMENPHIKKIISISK